MFYDDVILIWNSVFGCRHAPGSVGSIRPCDVSHRSALWQREPGDLFCRIHILPCLLCWRISRGGRTHHFHENHDSRFKLDVIRLPRFNSWFFHSNWRLMQIQLERFTRHPTIQLTGFTGYPSIQIMRFTNPNLNSTHEIHRQFYYWIYETHRQINSKQDWTEFNRFNTEKAIYHKLQMNIKPMPCKYKYVCIYMLITYYNYK